MLENMNKMTFMGFWLGSVLIGLAFLGDTGSVQAQTALERAINTEAKISDWNPPDGVGSSGSPTRGAGSDRVPNCSAKLQALVPSVIEGRIGIESPMLAVYVEQKGSERETAQFKLTYYDEDGEEVIVFQQTLKDFPRDRLFMIPLPTDLVLEKERVYHWQFALQCDRERYVGGAMSLEPNEISGELLARLAVAAPIEKAKIYMNQGWWYDAIKVLQEIQAQEPENLEAVALWTKLLTAEGRENLL